MCDSTFCTQAGKTVRLIPGQEPAPEPDASPNASAICLDMNRRCTTAKCPVTQAPTPLMALRLVRSGVGGVTEQASVHCPECDRETIHDVVGWAQAVCRGCGGVRRWTELINKR